MNLLKLFQKEKTEKENRIASQISHIGAVVSDKELQRILSGEKTENLIPITVKIGDVEIKSEAYLSIRENPDGSDSLQIHSLVNDQNRLLAIANSENGVETALSFFRGDENKMLSFMRRNMLNESFLPAYHRSFETSNYSHFVNSYLALNSDANYNQVDNAYQQTVAEFKRLDENFRKEASRFNKIRGVLLSNKEINDLKQGKTILVSGLIDDKGEKFTGYVKLNLSPEELKFYKKNPTVVINLHDKAVITPKNEFKVQVNHNNHGFKTEENKYSGEKIKSGETLTNETKANKRSLKVN